MRIVVKILAVLAGAQLALVSAFGLLFMLGTAAENGALPTALIVTIPATVGTVAFFHAGFARLWLDSARMTTTADRRAQPWWMR